MEGVESELSTHPQVVKCAVVWVQDSALGEIPRIFKGEIYATVSLTGAAAFVGLQRAGVSLVLSGSIAATLIIALRISAIFWGIKLEPVALATAKVTQALDLQR